MVNQIEFLAAACSSDYLELLVKQRVADRAREELELPVAKLPGVGIADVVGVYSWNSQLLNYLVWG